MSNNQIVCHVCSFKMENQQIASVCERCGTDLQNPQNEQLIKMDVGNYVKKNTLSQSLCALYLTNKRLFLVPARKGVLGFGSDTGASGVIALRGGGGSKELDFSIPLESIQEVSEKKIKLSKSISIRTKNNEEYIVNMQDIFNKKAQEEWVNAISQAAGL